MVVVEIKFYLTKEQARLVALACKSAAEEIGETGYALDGTIPADFTKLCSKYRKLQQKFEK